MEISKSVWSALNYNSVWKNSEEKAAGAKWSHSMTTFGLVIWQIESTLESRTLCTTLKKFKVP